jgi:hypothetical protein
MKLENTFGGKNGAGEPARDKNDQLGSVADFDDLAQKQARSDGRHDDRLACFPKEERQRTEVAKNGKERASKQAEHVEREGVMSERGIVHRRARQRHSTDFEVAS